MKIKLLLSLGFAAILSMAPIVEGCPRDSRTTFAGIKPEDQRFLGLILEACVTKVVEENSSYSMEDFKKMAPEKQNALLQGIRCESVIKKLEWLEITRIKTGKTFEDISQVVFNDQAVFPLHISFSDGLGFALFPGRGAIPENSEALTQFLDGYSVGVFPKLELLGIKFGHLSDELCRSFDVALDSVYIKSIKSLHLAKLSPMIRDVFIRSVGAGNFSALETLCLDVGNFDIEKFKQFSCFIEQGKIPNLNYLKLAFATKDEELKARPIIRNAVQLCPTKIKISLEHIIWEDE